MNSSNGVVLVIDDTRDNRILLSSQLKMEGYSILEAGGGRMGLEMARAENPDIILLDVMMPDMDGFEVCRHLKNDPETANIPIVMVTALQNVESRIEGKKAGADEFLSRPHNREELLVRVRTFIQVKRTRVSLDEERNRLRLLYNIASAISSELELEAMMSKIIIETQAAVGATKGNIMLLNSQQRVTHKFMSRANSELEVSDTVAHAVMTRGLGGWLLRHMRTEIIEDIRVDPRWITLPDQQEETGAAIGLPLTVQNRIVGIIILNHPRVGYFTEEHRDLLQAIANTVATAIQNANLYIQAQEERQKLSAILAQSTDAIITTDENWSISLVNKAARTLFNLTPDEVTNQPLQEVDALRSLHAITQSAAEFPRTEELNLNNHKTFFTSISPIVGVGFAIVMQDITELKQAEAIRLEKERLEKEQVKDTFMRYMGPSLVEHVLSNEPGLMLRRERRRAVVMFADLRDSTRFIRLVDTDAVIERLNKHFTKMTETVYEYEGTIFELTGDEILIAFNAPFDQADAAQRALETAVAMQKKFNSLRNELFQDIGHSFGMGIGIDLGFVVVGNVGAETRMTFRMVGDAVNMAHRLVDIAVDGQIVVSTSLFNEISTASPALLNRIPMQPMGPYTFKGKDEPEQVYAIQIPR